MSVILEGEKGVGLTYVERDENLATLENRDIVQAGQIKANYTGLELIGFSDGVVQQFDIAAAPVTLSSEPTTLFPYSASANDYSALFDTSRGSSPVTGRLIENPVAGQVHFWRFEVNFADKSGNNVGELKLVLRNPVSGFTYNMSNTLPSSTTFGVFNTTAITIADSASIPFPNGYILEAVTTFGDNNLLVGINSITRFSLAIDRGLEFYRNINY